MKRKTQGKQAASFIITRLLKKKCAKSDVSYNYLACSGVQRVFRPAALSFSVLLSFSHVCRDSRCLSADVKQRTTGMHCQMETLVYLTDTNTGRRRLSLRPEGPAAAFSWPYRVPKTCSANRPVQMRVISHLR